MAATTADVRAAESLILPEEWLLPKILATFPEMTPAVTSVHFAHRMRQASLRTSACIRLHEEARTRMWVLPHSRAGWQHLRIPPAPAVVLLLAGVSSEGAFAEDGPLAQVRLAMQGNRSFCACAVADSQAHLVTLALYQRHSRP